MWNNVFVQLAAAAVIGLAGLFVARGSAVVLTQEGAGLLMVLAAVVLMFRAIDRHFDGRS
ncbi:hypothetical protein [Falsiroseomonas oryziterrae]|uniref:hypothetical protein n=1 Tax=Falsiroseomonas oryziterrae TaxID=2911368 RepID=UPI001F309D63|nr:hypothetical protein [Roseomonas sp. NPKOSM-4]